MAGEWFGALQDDPKKDQLLGKYLRDSVINLFSCVYCLWMFIFCALFCVYVCFYLCAKFPFPISTASLHQGAHQWLLSRIFSAKCLCFQSPYYTIPTILSLVTRGGDTMSDTEVCTSSCSKQMYVDVSDFCSCSTGLYL